MLLSGGIDSTVLAAQALSEGLLRGCVFVDYGQPATNGEYAAAHRWCDANDVELFCYRCEIDTWQLSIGAGAPGSRVVTGRNAIILSLACHCAGARGAAYLWYGATWEDQVDYPDCRVGFYRGISEVFRAAYGVRVCAPYAGVDRQQILEKAKQLGVDLSNAWSCYEPIEGQPCGTCNPCRYAA